VCLEMDILDQIAPNFFNIRHSFRIMMGLINVGTHMSLIKLKNGNYLVIDTIPLSPGLKQEIDVLTDFGTKMEAVIATHPFHTLAFPSFYQAYPDAPYYGTPRHLRKWPQIPWKGSVDDCEIRSKWYPEVEMRIPDGAEFVNPMPERTNHFSGVFVYHRESLTIHVDDTLFYAVEPNILMKLGGFRHGQLSFHPSMNSVGLHHTPEAPYLFRDWVNGILNDWEFDNLVTAHMGNKIGGAKKLLRELLDRSLPNFDRLHEKYAKNPSSTTEPSDQHYNVDGSECG